MNWNRHIKPVHKIDIPTTVSENDGIHHKSKMVQYYFNNVTSGMAKQSSQLQHGIVSEEHHCPKIHQKGINAQKKQQKPLEKRHTIKLTLANTHGISLN